MDEDSSEALDEAIPVSLVVFHVEQVVCLEEVKEETYNKVLLDVLDEVVEMWLGIVTKSVKDNVELYDAFLDHVV